MRPTDIDKMTMKQLKDLALRVDLAMERARARESEQLREKAKEMIERAGFTVKDVFTESPNLGARRAKKPGERGPDTRPRKKKPRVYNPDNPDQSYGGYGPKPAWFKKLEAQEA